MINTKISVEAGLTSGFNASVSASTHLASYEHNCSGQSSFITGSGVECAVSLPQFERGDCGRTEAGKPVGMRQVLINAGIDTTQSLDSLREAPV